MCQLSLLNFHEDFDLTDPEIKDELHNLLWILSIVNAQDHRDGHGITFYDKKSKKNVLLKTEKTGTIGTIVEQLDSKDVELTSPIIFHVRAASSKYKKDDVIKEKAHPFEGDNFILAHNGTFRGKHVTANKDDDLIDSQIFHRELEKRWKNKEQKETIEDVLQDVLDDFSGKFALLFKNKNSNKSYVIRGYSADLHKVEIKYKDKVVGYFINTEKDPIYIINNMSYRFLNFTFDLKESPETLDRYKLFEVGEKDLLEVGKINYFANTAVTVYNNARQYNRGRKSATRTRSKVKKGDLEDINGLDLDWLINDFMSATKLSIPEVNLIFTLLGFPIPYIQNKAQYINVENKLKRLFNKHYRKEKREIITDIVKSGVTIQEFHELYTFPYFILETEELNNIKKDLING